MWSYFLFIFLSVAFFYLLFKNDSNQQLHIAFIVGLSLLIGVAYPTFLMFIFSWISIPINSLTLYLGLLFSIVIIYGLTRSLKLISRPADFAFRIMVPKDISWFVMFFLVCYLLYGICTKALFWPVGEYDSMTGFDLQAKMIAHQGTLFTDIFQYPRRTSYDVARFTYPPMVSGQYATAYIFGISNPKWANIWIVLGFVFCFYGLLYQIVPASWALFAVCLTLITPEFFSHIALGLTNFPHAVYASIGILSLLVFFNNHIYLYFIASLACMIGAQWTRLDNIVFTFVAIGFVFLYSLRVKKWDKFLIFSGSLLTVFVVWSLTVALQMKAASSDFFIKKVFFDLDKLAEIFSKCGTLVLGNTDMYGYTFVLFLLISAVFSIELFKNVSWLWFFIMFTWLGYTLLYYQIDYTFAGSIDAYIQASYKRGLFVFVPLCWYFIFEKIAPFVKKWTV